MLRTIDRLLTAPLIDLDLKARSPEEAIRDVAGLLASVPAVLDPQTFLDQVLEREKLSPTTTGNGVAFPHARTDAVSEIVMAAGRSPAGFPFAAQGPPIHFVFLIGTPTDSVRDYLALVGNLARILRDRDVREELLSVNSPENFVSVLTRAR